MMFAKLQNGVPVPAPYEKDGTINYNSEANEEQLLCDGYKPVVETEKPEGNFFPFYTETEDAITVSWEEAKEEPDRLSAIEEAITDLQLALCELYEGGE